MIRLSKLGKKTRGVLAAVLSASMIFGTNISGALAMEDAAQEGLFVQEDGSSAAEVGGEADAADVSSDDGSLFEDDVIETEEEQVSALEEEEIEVSGTGESAKETEADVDGGDGDNNIVTAADVSGNVVSGNQTDGGSTSSNGIEVEGNTAEIPAPEGFKAVMTKTNTVKLTWKKVKGYKYYHVYRMLEDGTADMKNELYYGKKASFVDKYAEGSDVKTYAYKVMADDGAGGLGHASYTVAAPIITEVKRTTEDDNLIAMDVSFTTVKGAQDYELYRAASKKASYAWQKTSLNTNGTKVDPYVGGGRVRSKTGASVLQEKIMDDENVKDMSLYFYKVRARFQIGGGELIESDYSAVLSGRVTTRAPKLHTVSANDGTSIYIEWEDMEEATDADGNKLINSGDYYQIYLATGKSKFKKLTKIKASSNKLETVKETVESDEKEYLTAEEAKEAELGTTAGWYSVPVTNYFVGYELEDLKPMTDYTVKVSVIKKDIEGSVSDSKSTRTELNDIKGLKVKNTDLNSVLLNWEEVEGATAYNVYYGEVSKRQFENGDYSSVSWKKTTAKVEGDKDDICEFEKTKLTNFEYYAFYVEPTYNKKEHDSGKNRIYVAAKTRIAAPDVEVTQSTYNATNNTLKLTWPAIEKATGYIAKYYVGSSDLSELDSKLITTKELKKSATSLNITGVDMGKPVIIRITTMYEKNNVSDEDAIGNSYEAVEYACPKEVEITDAAYNNSINTGAYISFEMKTSEPSGFRRGVKILRSSKKSKDYEVIEEFSDNFKYYRDDNYNKDGKKVYYRIYSVLRNTENPDWVAESRDYTECMYCVPTSVDDSDVSVAVGDTKSFTLTFKPAAATAKHVAGWEVSDDKTDTFSKGYGESNDYIKITTTDYGDAVKDYKSPTIKIKGKKKGKCYIQATLANGLVATIKVKITEKEDTSSSSSAKEEEDNGKNGKGKIICLDPGHGGDDGGCAYGSYKESEITLKISQYTKKYLEDAGFTVKLTRTEDKNVDLEKRVKIAKDAGAVAIISQHINSGSGSGVECYYSIDGTGKSLATSMCKKTAKATGMNNRGAKTRESGTNAGKDYYAIIRYARANDSNGKAITGLIMENGFIQSDNDYMNTDKKLKKIAEANAEAIIAYYGD